MGLLIDMERTHEYEVYSAKLMSSHGRFKDNIKALWKRYWADHKTIFAIQLYNSKKLSICSNALPMTVNQTEPMISSNMVWFWVDPNDILFTLHTGSHLSPMAPYHFDVFCLNFCVAQCCPCFFAVLLPHTCL